jgi:DNA-binding LytR/AlgR family response regulator
LYAALRDKYAALEKIESNLSAQDLPELTDRRSAAGLSMVPFRDEKGVLKFSIKKEDLLYIESADNYVMIYYLDGDKPAKYIVRNTLKRIEQELPNAGLVRSHRSYMVNINRVKVIRKEKEGLVIGFESPANIVVPISKTYLDVFIRKLSD